MTVPTTTTVPYTLTRLGVVMAPQPGDPLEELGVLNPASGRTPDGRLHLLPRMVAAGNVSRVGLAEVVLEDGVPVGVERRASSSRRTRAGSAAPTTPASRTRARRGSRRSACTS